MGLLAQLAAEAETAAAWRGEFRRLLALLAQVQAGTTDVARVKIDLVGEGWSIEAPPAAPGKDPAP